FIARNMAPPPPGPAPTGMSPRSSPPPGRSMRITSAPRSPSNAAQKGPAMKRPKSRTRTPSSTPGKSWLLAAPGVAHVPNKGGDEEIRHLEGGKMAATIELGEAFETIGLLDQAARWTRSQFARKAGKSGRNLDPRAGRQHPHDLAGRGAIDPCRRGKAARRHI